MFKWHLVSALCQTEIFMVFVCHSLSTENEWDFAYNFFTATIVDNLFDNPVLF